MSSSRKIRSQSDSAANVIALGLLCAACFCLLVALLKALPAAFSMTASLGTSSRIFRAAGKARASTTMSSWLEVAVWLSLTSVAGFSFLTETVLTDRWTQLSSPWMFLAGLASLLYVVQRIYDARLNSREELRSVLSELCVLAWLSAFVSFGSRRSSVPADFTYLIIRLWSLGTSLEGLLRLIMAALSGSSLSEALSERFLLRQLLFGKADPPTSLNDSEHNSLQDKTIPLDTLQQEQLRQARWGRLSVLAGLMTTSVTVWLLSGIVIIQPRQMGACFRLGVLQDEMLSPGIHWTLPHPFSRTTIFSAQQLRATTVGYVADLRKISTMPMLWTKTHGDAEFPLIVGDGTEMVAINAVVHYRVADSREEHSNYVTSARDPDLLVRNLAQHVLMTETRSKTLQALIDTDRSAWSRMILDHIQMDVTRLELGIEVVQFDVLSIHPPVEVADSFLEIVTARVDAEREISEAMGASVSERTRCEMMSATNIADATAAASVRLTAVMHEALHLNAMAASYGQHPDLFRQRAVCSVIGEALIDHPLTLIDRNLPENLRLWIGGQREMHSEVPR